MVVFGEAGVQGNCASLRSKIKGSVPNMEMNIVDVLSANLKVCTLYDHQFHLFVTSTSATTVKPTR